jgi:transposase
MYSIMKAAALLGKSEMTIRRWIKRFDIQLVVVETTRKRVYIADDDMNILVDYIYHKAKTKHEAEMRKEHSKHREMIMVGEVKYYSLAHAASLLGVSVNSVKRWIKQDNVEKKHITIDARRVYIAHEDVLRMAEVHRCKVAPQLYENTAIQRDINTMYHGVDELCSIKEAALYLDVSNCTVREWIRQANIETKTKFVGRDITSITYSDVVRLADLHHCTIVPHPSSLTVKEEIKEMKEMLQKHESAIEDITHDLRLLAKRSIYIG